MNIQLNHRAREITRQNITARIPPAITQLPCRTIRTRKAQRSRTTPNDIAAQVLARHHLFIRTRIDKFVDHRIARTVIPEAIAVGFVELVGDHRVARTVGPKAIAVGFLELIGDLSVEDTRAVGKGGVDVAGLQPVVVCGPVFAAGDDDGAEPAFVVSFAVFAGSGEGVLRFRGGIACYLR